MIEGKAVNVCGPVWSEEAEEVEVKEEANAEVCLVVSLARESSRGSSCLREYICVCVCVCLLSKDQRKVSRKAPLFDRLLACKISGKLSVDMCM